MSQDFVEELGPDPSLLLVDDDEPFLRRLAKAMEKRGFVPEIASSVAGGRAIALDRPFTILKGNFSGLLRLGVILLS